LSGFRCRRTVLSLHLDADIDIGLWQHLAGTFAMLGMPNHCEPGSGCYIRSMFRCANKLLSFVLVLIVAVGPIGGAMAEPHVCDPEKVEVSDSMPHAEHARHQAANENMAQDQQLQCSDCASGCCMGGACSTSACGAGTAALLTHATTKFAGLSSATIAAESQLPLAERHSPPFRPPQV